MKIQIIGIGRLGSQVAMLSMMMLKPERITIEDIKDTNGDWYDLVHARNGLGMKTKILLGVDKCADVYILCCGRARDTGETDEELLEINIGKVWEVIRKLPEDVDKIVAVNPVSDIVYMLTRSGYKNIHHAEEELDEMRKGTECDGQKILKTKGYTNFGPAVAIVKKIEELICDR